MVAELVWARSSASRVSASFNSSVVVGGAAERSPVGSPLRRFGSGLAGRPYLSPGPSKAAPAAIRSAPVAARHWLVSGTRSSGPTRAGSQVFVSRALAQASTSAVSSCRCLRYSSSEASRELLAVEAGKSGIRPAACNGAAVKIAANATPANRDRTIKLELPPQQRARQDRLQWAMQRPYSFPQIPSFSRRHTPRGVCADHSRRG